MFGFLRKKDDLRALNQRMGRLLNSVQYSDLNNEKQRSESRTRVAQPCIVFRFNEASSPKSYTTGISSDISLHGMSLFVPDAIEHGDYILILGDGESQVMLQAACKRCVRTRFGFYSVGFEFIKVLHESSYPAIVEAAALIDATPVAPVAAAAITYPTTQQTLV